MTTNSHSYLFEVIFKINGQMNYRHIRARDKLSATRVASQLLGDISIVSVSLWGN